MNDAPPTGRALWIAGARPRTLPAAVVPVAVGAACAVGESVDAWWRAIFALIVALALQVGVNYANDYSDGVRGTDDERRVGPLRLVGSGLAPAASVKRAAQISFATAGVFGGVLALVVGPELLVVGALSIIAGWTYTGGPKPYGYLGLGEIFVFVFFGVVATVGTTYVLLEEVQTLSLVASVAVGYGGEGATLREVLKHKTVEQATMIEIDEVMVNVSHQYLPSWSDCSAFTDTEWCVEEPRADVRYEDALAWFIDRFDEDGSKRNEGTEPFDVIIMDALDPQDNIPFAEA